MIGPFLTHLANLVAGLASAYGLAERQRLDIIPLLGRRTQAIYNFLARQAAQGDQPWARFRQGGYVEAWQEDTSYITQPADQWRQAPPITGSLQKARSDET